MNHPPCRGSAVFSWAPSHDTKGIVFSAAASLVADGPVSVAVAGGGPRFFGSSVRVPASSRLPLLSTCMRNHVGNLFESVTWAVLPSEFPTLLACGCWPGQEGHEDSGDAGCLRPALRVAGRFRSPAPRLRLNPLGGRRRRGCPSFLPRGDSRLHSTALHSTALHCIGGWQAKESMQERRRTFAKRFVARASARSGPGDGSRC